MTLRSLLAVIVLASGVASADKQEAERRINPFSSNVVTGPLTGTQHCYVCDIGDRPAILVFARKMDGPTAALMHAVRDAVGAHADRGLFGWFVFLGETGSEPESRLEESAHAFAVANGAASLPVSALGEPNGPPGYDIPRDAELTVLLFRQRRVVSRITLTPRRCTPASARAALGGLPRLLSGAPSTAKPAGVNTESPVGSVDTR